MLREPGMDLMLYSVTTNFLIQIIRLLIFLKVSVYLAYLGLRLYGVLQHGK